MTTAETDKVLRSASEQLKYGGIDCHIIISHTPNEVVLGSTHNDLSTLLILVDSLNEIAKRLSTHIVQHQQAAGN